MRELALQVKKDFGIRASHEIIRKQQFYKLYVILACRCHKPHNRIVLGIVTWKFAETVVAIFRDTGHQFDIFCET